MKHVSKRVLSIISLLLLVSVLMQGMAVYAAGNANLNVTKNGKSFKLTNGEKSYSFRYDWDEKKGKYTGYSQKKANKVVPAGTLHLGLGRDGQTTNKDDSIAIVKEGLTLNKRIYIGMPLAEFHKKIKSAWGTGYYAYWDNKKKAVVKVGTKKPSNSFVQKRSKDTGLFWTGKRGVLTLSISIGWNKTNKRAETGWTEIFGSESD